MRELMLKNNLKYKIMNILEELEFLMQNNEDDFGKGKYILQQFIDDHKSKLNKHNVSDSYKIKSGKYCSDCGKEFDFIDNQYDGYGVFGDKTKRRCLTCTNDNDLL